MQPVARVPAHKGVDHRPRSLIWAAGSSLTAQLPMPIGPHETKARRKPLPPANLITLADLPSDDGMNDLERRYAEYLLDLKARGLILAYDYEAVRFRLADGSWYKPDFRVVLPDRTIELHEIKGFWREAARVRIKVADEMHPHVFRAVTRGKMGWMWETITRGADEWVAQPRFSG